MLIIFSFNSELILQHSKQYLVSGHISPHLEGHRCPQSSYFVHLSLHWISHSALHILLHFLSWCGHYQSQGIEHNWQMSEHLSLHLECEHLLLQGLSHGGHAPSCEQSLLQECEQREYGLWQGLSHAWGWLLSWHVKLHVWPHSSCYLHCAMQTYLSFWWHFILATDLHLGHVYSIDLLHLFLIRISGVFLWHWISKSCPHMSVTVVDSLHGSHFS